MDYYFEPVFNNLGKLDQIIRRPDGASVLFYSATGEFDEANPVTKSFRQWESFNGALDLSDRPVDPLTLEQFKAQKKQEIIAIASAKQEELVAGFAPPEQASWARKVAEAKTFLASGVIEDAPMLKVEAIAISGATNNTVILRYTQGLASDILHTS
jgi:hypothetical protein